MATPRFPAINWDEAAHVSNTMRAMGPGAFGGRFPTEQTVPTFEPIDWSTAAVVQGRTWGLGSQGATGDEAAEMRKHDRFQQVRVVLPDGQRLTLAQLIRS